MGSACRIVVFGGPPGLDAVLEAEVHRLEGLWSRFRPDSEISRLNRDGGPTLVSPETLTLVRTAVDAHTLTGGVFDPLLLRPLEALGYDRDHQRLDVTRDAITVDATVTLPDRGDAMLVDEALACVQLPADRAFDPGGLGKGVAADHVTDLALARGAAGVLVDLGGDLRMEGTWVDGGPFPVTIADPDDGEATVASILVTGGGVATSNTLRRRWRSGDSVNHHLIDPLTGRSATSDLVAVTVHAGSAWAADVLAKAALILGREAGSTLLASSDVNAVMIGEDRVRSDVGHIVEPVALS